MIKTTIEINKLNKTSSGRDFSYNNYAEKLVTNAFCFKYALDNRGGTVGFAPEYDRLIENTKVEIKISSRTTPFIEFEKSDDSVTGISLTESDIYMFINPGRAEIKNNWIDMMKVRLVYTRELKLWINYMRQHYNNELIEFKPNELGKGSKGFNLNFKYHKGPTINDLFVMGFEYTKDVNNNIIFDTSNILMPNNPSFAENNISKYIR